MSRSDKIGKLATTITTDDKGNTVVTYHETSVVTFNDKEIILNTGGWFTNTTKERMNQVSNVFKLGFYVQQVKGVWEVVFRNKQGYIDLLGHKIPFTQNSLVIRR